MKTLVIEFAISHYDRKGRRLIRRKNLAAPQKINLGCGPSLKPGYLNIDMMPGGDVTLDIRRGLPFDSNSCDKIFSEHCFEHLDYPKDVTVVAGDCFRILKPGGELRLSVPDTEWPIRDYPLGDNSSYLDACREYSWWHPTYCTTRIEHINYHFRQKGEHRFAYDFETMGKVLAGVGFVDIRKVEFDASLDSEHRRVGSLFVSARKPS